MPVIAISVSMIRKRTLKMIITQKGEKERTKVAPAKGHGAPPPLHLGSPQAITLYASLPSPISKHFYYHPPHSSCTHIWILSEQGQSQTIWAHPHDEQGSITDPSSDSMNQAPVQSRIRAGFGPMSIIWYFETHTHWLRNLVPDNNPNSTIFLEKLIKPRWNISISGIRNCNLLVYIEKTFPKNIK